MRTEQLQAFTLAVGYGYGSHVCRDGDSLRLAKAWHASDVGAGTDIEDFNRVVAKRSHIEALRRSIVGKVIDAPLDMRQLDGANQRQRLLRRARLNRHGAEHQSNDAST